NHNSSPPDHLHASSPPAPRGLTSRPVNVHSQYPGAPFVKGRSPSAPTGSHRHLDPVRDISEALTRLPDERPVVVRPRRLEPEGERPGAARRPARERAVGHPSWQPSLELHRDPTLAGRRAG